ncbi:hypothetical protein fHeYen801_012 [Yersinia phage fHe-Yen8-01]|nr:hypothetical protein fHeYen801_012 [Yersinia phage fHe-Yen8-01]
MTSADTPEIPLTLVEFCKRKSAEGENHALLAGFYYTENAAERNKDLPSAYAERYKAYPNTPAI